MAARDTGLGAVEQFMHQGLNLSTSLSVIILTLNLKWTE